MSFRSYTINGPAFGAYYYKFYVVSRNETTNPVVYFTFTISRKTTTTRMTTTRRRWEWDFTTTEYLWPIPETGEAQVRMNKIIIAGVSIFVALIVLIITVKTCVGRQRQMNVRVERRQELETALPLTNLEPESSGDSASSSTVASAPPSYQTLVKPPDENLPNAPPPSYNEVCNNA